MTKNCDLCKCDLSCKPYFDWYYTNHIFCWNCRELFSNSIALQKWTDSHPKALPIEIIKNNKIPIKIPMKRRRIV